MFNIFYDIYEINILKAYYDIQKDMSVNSSYFHQAI